MYKCPNCGATHEGVVCHACGYEDVALKEHLEHERIKAKIDLGFTSRFKIGINIFTNEKDEAINIFRKVTGKNPNFVERIKLSEAELDNIKDAEALQFSSVKEYDEYLDKLRAKEQEEDNRMVSLHLPVVELYDLQAALCKVEKTDLLACVMDRIGLLIEADQNIRNKSSKGKEE